MREKVMKNPIEEQKQFAKKRNCDWGKPHKWHNLQLKDFKTRIRRIEPR